MLKQIWSIGWRIGIGLVFITVITWCSVVMKEDFSKTKEATKYITGTINYMKASEHLYTYTIYIDKYGTERISDRDILIKIDDTIPANIILVGFYYDFRNKKIKSGREYPITLGFKDRKSAAKFMSGYSGLHLKPGRDFIGGH